MKIDLVGPLPPPFGGVSVHLHRLVTRLRDDQHDVSTHAPQAHGEHILRAYWRMGRRCKGDLIHFHLHGILDKFFMGVLARLGKRVLLTVHSQSLENQVRSLPRGRRRLLTNSMQSLSGLIAVNEQIRDFAIEELGIHPDRAYTIPAYLPPDRDAFRAQSPTEDIQHFLDNHHPIITANAFNLSMDKGVPLYGSDLLVDLLSELRLDWPKAGVVFFISTISSHQEPAFDTLCTHIQNAGLDKHFLRVTGSRPFGPTLVRSDLMVRPTSTDGDSLSIREALFLGIPVIASDVVARPEGTHLFQYRDPTSLLDVARQTLQNAEQDGGMLHPVEQQDWYPDILNAYENALA